MSQTVKHSDEATDELSDVERRALQLGAVVHRRTRFGPFVPDPVLRVVGPLDVRELMGRCDPDDDDVDVPRSEE